MRSMLTVASVSMQDRTPCASHLTESISHPGARSKRVMTDEQDNGVRNFPNASELFAVSAMSSFTIPSFMWACILI